MTRGVAEAPVPDPYRTGAAPVERATRTRLALRAAPVAWAFLLTLPLAALPLATTPVLPLVWRAIAVGLLTGLCFAAWWREFVRRVPREP